jgi:hypothetical protein
VATADILPDLDHGHVMPAALPLWCRLILQPVLQKDRKGPDLPINLSADFTFQEMVNSA